MVSEKDRTKGCVCILKARVRNNYIIVFGLVIIMWLIGKQMRNVGFYGDNDGKSGGDVVNWVDGLSGLEEVCIEAIGEELYVKTIYGWGWHGNKEEPDAVESFRFVLDRLWVLGDEDEIRGGVGTITEKRHDYERWKVIFSTRHRGLFNFTMKIGTYNVRITKEIQEKGSWPSPKNPEQGCGGLGKIGFKEMVERNE